MYFVIVLSDAQSLLKPETEFQGHCLALVFRISREQRRNSIADAMLNDQIEAPISLLFVRVKLGFLACAIFMLNSKESQHMDTRNPLFILL